MNRPPLTPPDCDLRDFPFMPLDVARLRDSDLSANETPEACWAALLLWSASWHQIPAGSIPNDDFWIAKAAGYMMRGKIDKAWKDVSGGALHGFVECSDGRLYHPVVAEKAREAWEAKLRQRWRTECARIKKHNERHKIKGPIPDFDEWMSLGCPRGHALPVPRDKSDPSLGTDGNCPNDVPCETASKGQGEGQGQRQVVNPLSVVARCTTSTVVTPAGAVCARLKSEARITDANPQHPKLLALLEAGLSEDEIVVTGIEANRKGKGFLYALAVAEGRRRDAANIKPLPRVPAPENFAGRDYGTGGRL